MKLIDLSGRRFGSLVVHGKSVRRTKHGHPLWSCSCDCGSTTETPGYDLRTGHTKSCGCLTRGTIGLRRRTHGRTASRLYRIWAAMKSRCLNANIANYDRYGGRGIGICNAWAESFERFAADMGEPPSKTHSIDRINNDGDYEPGNCRWATPKEQARNSSSVSLIAAFGEIKSLVEWSEDPRCGTTLSALRHRLSRRWLPESAIVAAPNVKKRSAPWPQQ